MDIKPLTGVVVIGDGAALERLEPQLTLAARQHIDLLSPEPLLVPYDRQTVEGEGRLRALEQTYAGLRDKLLVRLLVVNLNPEVVGRLSEPPLRQIRHEWEEIHRRRFDLLNEGAGDGVGFVTVLVTENGDLLEEHQEDLQVLSGESDAGGHERHRCYLMTRLLELGQAQALHAQDVWPVLVAELVDHLHRQFRSTNRSEQNPSGLYAWRTVRFVPHVDERLVRSTISSAFSDINAGLLREPGRPVFEQALDESLVQNQAVEFNEPAPVAESRARFESERWNLLGTSRVQTQAALPADLGFPAAALAAPQRWTASIASFALETRALLRQRLEQATIGELASLRTHLNKSDAQQQPSPGLMFPGAMPPFKLLTERTYARGIHDIERNRAATKGQERLLTLYWRTHAEAARCFLALPERLLIAGAVVVALAYVSIVCAFVLADLTAAGRATGLSTGIVFALCGAAGAFGIVALEHMVQNFKGQRARDLYLKQAVGEYIRLRCEELVQVGVVVNRAVDTAILHRQQSARLTLHHRLARVERTLRSELQPPASMPLDESGPSASDTKKQVTQREDSSLVEYVVRLAEVESTAPDGDFLTELKETAIKEFGEEWGQLREIDVNKLGFVPLPKLLSLCQRHTDRLQSGIYRRLRENAIKRWSNQLSSGDQDVLKEAIKRAVSAAQLDETQRNTRLLSVDLIEKSNPVKVKWVAEGFADFFKDENSSCGLLSPDESGTGVLAVWHTEFRIKGYVRSTSDGSKRLEFKCSERT